MKINPPTKEKWYIRAGVSVIGPFDRNDLDRMYITGKLQPGHSVSHDGKRWVPARKLFAAPAVREDSPASAGKKRSRRKARSGAGKIAGTLTLTIVVLVVCGAVIGLVYHFIAAENRNRRAANRATQQAAYRTTPPPMPVLPQLPKIPPPSTPQPAPLPASPAPASSPAAAPLPAPRPLTPPASPQPIPPDPTLEARFKALDQLDPSRAVLEWSRDAGGRKTTGVLHHFSGGRLVKLLLDRQGRRLVIRRQFLPAAGSPLPAHLRKIHFFIPLEHVQWNRWYSGGNCKYRVITNIGTSDPLLGESSAHGSDLGGFEFKPGPGGTDSLTLDLDAVLAQPPIASHVVQPPLKLYIFVRADASEYDYGKRDYLDFDKYFNTASNVLVVDVK